MSEEASKPHRFSVCMDDFIRFLQAKTGESVCSACKAERWTVVGVAETDATYRLATPLRDGRKNMALNTFTVYCTNCGYVRQHLSRIVKEWVLDNPAPEQLELDELSDSEVNDVE